MRECDLQSRSALVNTSIKAQNSSITIAVIHSTLSLIFGKI